MPTPTSIPTNTPTPIPTPNLLFNGPFDQNGNSWLLPWSLTTTIANTTIRQDATNKIDGPYSAEISLPTAGSTDHDVQLNQANISLVTRKTYTLSFWAKASSNTSVRLAIRHGVSPWTAYFGQSVSLTPTWQKYILTFTVSQKDTNGMVNFNLSQNVANIWLDAVTLQ